MPLAISVFLLVNDFIHSAVNLSIISTFRCYVPLFCREFSLFVFRFIHFFAPPHPTELRQQRIVSRSRWTKPQDGSPSPWRPRRARKKGVRTMMRSCRWTRFSWRPTPYWTRCVLTGFSEFLYNSSINSELVKVSIDWSVGCHWLVFLFILTTVDELVVSWYLIGWLIELLIDGVGGWFVYLLLLNDVLINCWTSWVLDWLVGCLVCWVIYF